MINILSVVEGSDSLKALLPSKLNNITDKDIEALIKSINTKLDKKFKYLIRSHERSQLE
jgi:hypothetical protein